MRNGSNFDIGRTADAGETLEPMADVLEPMADGRESETDTLESVADGRNSMTDGLESRKPSFESTESGVNAKQRGPAATESERGATEADSERGSTAAIPLDSDDDSFQLLHVEDDHDFAALTETYLSRLLPDVEVAMAETVAIATEQYASTTYDAVLCDYDLPDGDGIDFLEQVRVQDETTPFILFTGKGSEEIASEAISAGVTDYLQKRGGIDQFEVLANRLRNAVDRSRLSKQVDRAFAALRAANEPIGILAADGTYLFANEAYAAVYGLTPADLIGNHWEPLYPASERVRFTDEILPAVVAEGHWSGEATGKRVDGTPIRETLTLMHTEDGGHVCIIRDAETVAESPNSDVDG